MLTLIASALCMTMLDATPAPGPADTVNVYIIDNKVVDDFNGTQLIGKEIESYIIAKSEKEPKKVHIITTSTPAFKIMGGDLPTKQEIDDFLKLMDGIKISTKDLYDLMPGRISEIEVFKAGSEEARAFGEKGANGVISVLTKDSSAYILNGKRITEDEFGSINPSDIKSITVLRDKASLKKYDAKDCSSIILVETKK